MELKTRESVMVFVYSYIGQVIMSKLPIFFLIIFLKLFWILNSLKNGLNFYTKFKLVIVIYVFDKF